MFVGAPAAAVAGAAAATGLHFAAYMALISSSFLSLVIASAGVQFVTDTMQIRIGDVTRGDSVSVPMLAIAEN